MRVLFAREQFNEGVLWDEMAPLLPGWDITTCPRNEILDHLDGVDVVTPFGAPVDAAAIRAGTFGLIQQFGVGLDAVDVDTATSEGVWVARLPAHLSGNGDSVAELAVLGVLAVLRRLDESRQALRERRWGQPVGRSLVDAHVLVVGLGATGGGVVSRLRPFGPRLTAVRANPDKGAPEGVDSVVGPGQLAEAVADADVVVCCAMLDADTANLFDAGIFAAFKPGSVFVNIARGGLVDEVALLAALDRGQIAGAALDVFATEPTDPAGQLVNHPNVVATPHVAGLTGRMFTLSARMYATNLQRWAGGDVPEWTVNQPPAPRGPAGD